METLSDNVGFEQILEEKCMIQERRRGYRRGGEDNKAIK